MVGLSLSQEPSKNIKLQALSAQSQDLSSMCDIPSPASQSEEMATLVAWRSAKDTYRESLIEKDLKQVMVPTGPEDVLNKIEA